MFIYPQSIDLEGNDSDTIPAPPSSKVVASGGIGSSKKHQAGKKRPRDVKSPTKTMKQPKSSFTNAIEHITTIMKAIQQTLANPPPAPQLPQLIDPSAALRSRIDEINISNEDTILIGEYLCLAGPNNEGMRSFLSYRSDKTLETWVYQFICKHEDRMQLLLIPGSTCFWCYLASFCC